jgi:hypothetical protein
MDSVTARQITGGLGTHPASLVTFVVCTNMTVVAVFRDAQRARWATLFRKSKPRFPGDAQPKKNAGLQQFFWTPSQCGVCAQQFGSCDHRLGLDTLRT